MEEIAPWVVEGSLYHMLLWCCQSLLMQGP